MSADHRLVRYEFDQVSQYLFSVPFASIFFNLKSIMTDESGTKLGMGKEMRER